MLWFDVFNAQGHTISEESGWKKKDYLKNKEGGVAVYCCYNPELGLLTICKMYLQPEESVLFPKNTFTTCCVFPFLKSIRNNNM
jgi:hypothetical protein